MEGQTTKINGKTYTAQQFYEHCYTEPFLPKNQTLPSGDIFKFNPENPNKSYKLTETGVHYFYCGRPDHCLKGGVKATVHVVNHVNECHIHPNC